MKSPRRALFESLEERTLLANGLLAFYLSGPTQITEGDTPGQYTAAYTVSLNGLSISPCSVVVQTQDGTAVAGRDYSPPSTTPLIFGLGQTQATVYIPITGNTTVQGNRTFTVSLTNPIGASLAASQMTTTIVDDDTPVVTISAPDAAASESGDPGTIRISRTSSTEKALSVILAVTGTAGNGTDYQTIRTTVSIPAGKAFLDIPIKPIADTQAEGAETVTIKLHGSTKYKLGSKRSATVTISDGETKPPVARLVSAPKLVKSGGSGYRFTVKYTDNVKMDLTSVGNNDLRVTGPNGYSQLARLVSKTAGPGNKTVTAIYTINAPGGAWDASDSGDYTIAVVANQVFDAAHNALTAGGLGQFTVAIPAPAPAQPFNASREIAF